MFSRCPSREISLPIPHPFLAELEPVHDPYWFRGLKKLWVPWPSSPVSSESSELLAYEPFSLCYLGSLAGRRPARFWPLSPTCSYAGARFVTQVAWRSDQEVFGRGTLFPRLTDDGNSGVRF